MKVIVEKTLQASLGIQWVTLFFNIYSLLQDIPDFHNVLKSVLTIETLVQIIELIFYTWYAFQVHRIADVTRYRYYDWLVTTPLMLFHSKDDHTLPVSNTEIVMKNVGSISKQRIELVNSYHVATLDNDQEVIFENSLIFVEANKPHP
jgi:hypothetical protein